VVTTAVKPAPPGSLDTAPTAHGSTSPGQSTAARPGGRISGSNREIRAYQKIKSDEVMVARAQGDGDRAHRSRRSGNPTS
jgi:hypothetical protein